MSSAGRQLWVVAHRWAGLTIALFLIVAGTTGALLPFEEQLTLLSRPDKAGAAPPVPGAAPLDGVDLAGKVEAATGVRLRFIPLESPTGHVQRLFVADDAEGPAPAFDTIWADPYTGAVRLAYRSTSFADLPQSAMGLAFALHDSLLLGGWGEWTLGVAALIWTADCFVGFVLTLPVRGRRPAGARSAETGWWRRWQPAWRVRWHARGFKLHFDLHRAGGLWLWPMLVVFAWSSVGMNLPAVHTPVMRAFGAQFGFSPPPSPVPADAPPVAFASARAVGRDLMAAEARRRGFAVQKEGGIAYDKASGLFQYVARTSLDLSTDDAATTIWYDAVTGRIAGLDLPRGVTTADTLIGWYQLMHRARIYGLPYRILVSGLGVLVVGLSVTGVVVWSRKRAARIMRTAAPRREPA